MNNQKEMLTSFAVKNFRGFASRIHWDLSKTGDYDFNAGAIRNGVLKNGMIYGSNGCGKSSLSLALFDLAGHLSQGYNKPYRPESFICAGGSGKLAQFEYEFDFSGQKVKYSYKKNHLGAFTAEQLAVESREVFRREGESIYLDSKEFPITQAAKERLTDNANSVSVVNYLLACCPLPEGHYLLSLKNFAERMIWLRCSDTREVIGLESGTEYIEEYVIQNRLTEDLSRFLAQTSGQEFEFVESPPGERVLMCKIGKKTLPLNSIISSGTSSLLLLYYWIKKMAQASFVFIDDFDAFYDFRTAMAVCRRLFALDCQLFLSSQETSLMTNDLLRPDCYFLLQKGKITPLNLCTEKDLRFAHNLERIYRGGGFDS